MFSPSRRNRQVCTSSRRCASLSAPRIHATNIAGTTVEPTLARQRNPIVAASGRSVILGGAIAQLLEDRLERLAEHAPHREERVAVGPAIDVVHGDDRGMLELALHLRLAQKPHARLVGELALAVQHLHRDLAADARIARQHDLAHAAGAEHGALGVARDLGVRRERAWRRHRHRATAGPRLRLRQLDVRREFWRRARIGHAPL
jgi:hypothetical protein